MMTQTSRPRSRRRRFKNKEEGRTGGRRGKGKMMITVDRVLTARGGNDEEQGTWSDS